MVGATAQLAASGPADQYLSAQPQITYFKQIWRRYTQFATESIEQSWTGDVDFGRKATVSLSRSGDLVTEVWLQVRLPDLADLNHIANAAASATEPVVSYARKLTQSTARVDAYTLDGQTKHLLAAHTTERALGSVAFSGSAVLSFTLAAPPAGGTAVGLAPVDPAGGALVETTLSGGTYTASAPLAQDVTYALVFGDDRAARSCVFRWTDTAQPTVSFQLAGLDRWAYTARVVAPGATSAPQQTLVAKWCNSVGHALVSSVEWELGGTRVDRHTAEHYDMLCELTETEEKRAGYSDMIGRYDDYDIYDDAKSSGGSRFLFVPMRFSFNTSPGSAMPILALQFHDCRLNFEFRPFMELIKTSEPVWTVQREPSMATGCKLFATYVFLGQEERNRFVSMPHEYLIEQVQAQVENVASAASMEGVVNRKVALTLNHPVKELVWVFQASANTVRDPVAGNNWFDYDIPGREGEEVFEEANLQLNGHDRFVKRPAKYFRLAQPWSHHTRVPAKRVHAYSFALHPESWQNPSGAANFSRIDSAHLNLTLNPNIPAGRMRIHALGYNILRIANGLSGLVFVN